MLLPVLAMLLLGIVSPSLLHADDPVPAPPSKAQMEALASSLQWQTGTITIQGGLAKINLSDDFRYLNAADSNKVLHDLWGNPEDPTVLGMIFPKDKGPIDDHAWGITVSYEDSGYVKDDDATKINYDELLKQMQTDAQQANAEREKQGYPSITLNGWAVPPRYDAASHKLYWAKNLRFGGETEDTLNYDVRILGRHGVLVLEAIAGMSQLDEINQKTPEILAMVDFQPGNTYAEFDPKVDKVAEYGLATLVAGGALAGAAKLGLLGAAFKWIVAAVLALKKLLIVAVVAVVAAVKKFWGAITGRSKKPPQPGQLPPGGT
jgi:uncharacterized membrane-anchored protein